MFFFFFFYFFFGTMWNLLFLSVNFFLNKFLFFGFFTLKLVEIGWIEFSFNSGVLSFLKNLILFNQSIYLNSYKVYILMFFIWFLIVFFFFY